MSEQYALALAIVLPVGAALVALGLAGGAGERTMPALLLVVAAGGAAAVAVWEVTGTSVEWRGFESSAFRAVLACGALLCAAAGMVHSSGPGERAGLAMAGGAAAASVFAPDALWLGLLLPIASWSYALTLVSSAEPSRARAFAPVALSDVLAVAGLGLAASHSLSVGNFKALPGALVLAGGVLRLGVVPGLYPSRSSGRALVLGALRAQGVLLCVAAASGSSVRGTALAAAGGAIGLILWASTVAGNGGSAAAMLPAALAAAGLGIGGAAGVWGAIMAIAAGFAAVTLESARAPTLARPAFAVAPIGGMLPAAALAGGAALRLAAVRPGYAPIALGVLAGAAAAVSAGWSAGRPPSEEPLSRLARAAVVPVALAVLGVLAFAPAVALNDVVARVSTDLGVAAPLAAVPERIPADLAIAAAIVAVAGFVIGSARRGDEQEDVAVVAPAWATGWAAPFPARAPEAPEDPSPARILVLAEIVALGFAVELFVVAGSRGWL